MGIKNNDDKLNYHLKCLVELGALKHKKFVFTQVPYTSESFRRIWQLALEELPEAVEMRGNWYDENDSHYGMAPIIFELWCVPDELEQWNQFYEAENVGCQELPL